MATQGHMTRDGIVVVTSCTARKVDSEGRARTAESLYRGEQHVRLMRGVRTYRRAGQPAGRLTLRILSAGKGLLPPSRKIESYDQSFHGQPREAIRRRANALQVPRQLRTLLGGRYDLALLLLGDEYLAACQLDHEMHLGGPTLAFAGPRVALRLPVLDGLRRIHLGNPEARRFSCGLIALKGELGGRILTALSNEPEALAFVRDPDADVLAWLDSLPRAGESVVEAK